MQKDTGWPSHAVEMKRLDAAERLSRICLGLALLLAACAPIPVAQLSGYRGAFDQTYVVSKDVLVDYDRTLTESKQRVASRQASKYNVALPVPLDWKDVTGEGEAKADPDIEVRRQALELIKRYNDLLADLADGKSAQELKAAVPGLVDSLLQVASLAGATVSPALAAAGPLAAEVADQLERARSRQQFADALKAGAPVVDKMFQVLTDDIASHYRLRAVMTNDKLPRLTRKASDQVSVLQRLYAEHAPPGGGDASFLDAAYAEAQANKLLAPMAASLAEYPYQFPYSSAANAPGLSGQTDADVKTALAEIERIAQSYGDLKQQVETLAELLKKYRQTLIDARKALAELQRAQAQQAQLTPVVNELLKSGFELKRALDDYRAAAAHAR